MAFVMAAMRKIVGIVQAVKKGCLTHREDYNRSRSRGARYFEIICYSNLGFFPSAAGAPRLKMWILLGTALLLMIGEGAHFKTFLPLMRSEVI